MLASLRAEDEAREFRDAIRDAGRVVVSTGTAVELVAVASRNDALFDAALAFLDEPDITVEPVDAAQVAVAAQAYWRYGTSVPSARGGSGVHSKLPWPAAFAVALVLVPAGEADGQTRSEKCRPATIELASPWRPAKAPEYVASFGDFAPDFGVGPDERWKQLGEHRTDAILEVETEVETRCDPDTCRTCVTAISARIGFTPSEIRLHEELRRNRCARKLTMLHERQHEAVTREAQAIAVREAERNLRWARYPHTAHVTRASGREAGQEESMRKVGDDLTRALEKAMAYEEAENSRLDRPERYRRESRRQWRICGNQ